MTLISNSIRISNDPSGKYPRHKTNSGAPAADRRFADHVGMVQSIATSSGLNDSGLFELNFRDDRYLPFEFAGAISSWNIRLPQPFMQFDPSTISDLIVHFKYTARDGGDGLKNLATENLQNKITSSIASQGLGLFQVVSAKRDFSTEWYKFLNSISANNQQELLLDITSRFPYFTKKKGVSIQINQVDILADSDLTSLQVGFSDPDQQVSAVALNQGNGEFGNLLMGSKIFGMNKATAGQWRISYADSSVTPLTKDNTRDLVFVFYYNLEIESN